MTNLLGYIESFSKLNIASIAGDKAPHKAILLLSVIDLVEKCKISSPHIALTDEFIDTFKRTWNNYTYKNTKFQLSIEKPFWHMNSEPFWHLIAMNGEDITKNNFIGTPYSIENLRKQIKYAEIDSELFKLMQEDDSRKDLKDVLIKKYALLSTVMPHKVDFSVFSPIADTELRNYQQKNKEKIYDAWVNSRSIMLQMPTGTGKTRLFVSIVKDLHNWGKDNKQAVKILLLAHRLELIDQISSNLGEKYGLAHGVIMASNMERKELPIQVGSVSTLNRRLQNWSDKEFDIIIVDEAHHIKADSYRKIIEEFPMAKVLGVTATPYRLNGAGFKEEFDDLILSDSVSKFIKNKYLSEYEYYSIKANSTTQRKIDNIKQLAFNGDYDEGALIDVLDKDHVRAGIVKTYLKYAKDKKGLVYTINKEHNKHICSQFIANGISARAIDSETKKEDREKIIQAFKSGEFDILCNVNIFSEGFDCPDIEFVQLARPTKSLSMYLQQVGRGLRTSENKDKVVFLDNVGLYKRFGLPSARRHWRKHFEGVEVTDTELCESEEIGVEERVVNYFDEGDEVVDLVHSSKDESAIDNSINENVIDMKSYEQEFRNYMLNKYKAQATVNNYSVGISKHIDPWIKANIDSVHTSVYHTIDIEQLSGLQSKLLKNKQFNDLNTQSHNRFSSALKQYVEFANAYENKADDNKVTKADRSRDEIDAEILVLEKYGHEIPQTLLEERQRAVSKDAVYRLPNEVEQRVKDLFADITDKVDIELNYCPTDGLRVNIIQDTSLVNLGNKLKVTLNNGTVTQCATGKNTLIEVVKYAGAENVEKTPEDKVAETKMKYLRRPSLNYKEMGLDVGSKLLFTKASETEVIISTERKVVYKGVEMSLTAITKQLLGITHALQPTAYWTFEGKNLRDIYDETYSLED